MLHGGGHKNLSVKYIAIYLLPIVNTSLSCILARGTNAKKSFENGKSAPSKTKSKN